MAKTINISLEYEPGEYVILKTDRKDKNVRLVKNWRIDKLQAVEYELSFGSSTSWHYAFEMDKTTLQKEEPKIGFKLKDA